MFSFGNLYTVCPRSLDPNCIVTYYINLAKTSWTHSTAEMILLGFILVELVPLHVPVHDRLVVLATQHIHLDLLGPNHRADNSSQPL